MTPSCLVMMWSWWPSSVGGAQFGVRRHWFGFHPYSSLLTSMYGEGNGTPLQYSCLANPMDGGAWWAAAHGVARSQTRLRDFTFTFHFHALQKEMAAHSSVLAWRIPGMGEPGGLPSMGSHRVGHNWRDLAAAAPATSMLNRTSVKDTCEGQLRYLLEGD